MEIWDGEKGEKIKPVEGKNEYCKGTAVHKVGRTELLAQPNSSDNDNVERTD